MDKTTISLVPHAINHPIEVSVEEYEKLVHLTQRGWSMCDTREECLAKLRYLRQGHYDGKIDETSFQEREKTLVLNWWRYRN